MPGTRLKVAPLPLRLVRFRFPLPPLQVFEARQTIAAADGFEMKLDVAVYLFVECFEQVTAELFASRATDAVPAPDRADRVSSLIPLPDQRHQTLAQRLVVSHRLLDRCHHLRWKSLFQECFEF